MPCFNAMPYLPEALDSIINQTYTNLEILCINDGSTDETGDVLERYAKQDKRIRVIHNESNLKLIATLNKGIELARGEFIARMDADDISAINRLEVQIKYLLQNKDIDLVSCGSYSLNESGVKLGENLVRNYSTKGTEFASYIFRPIGHPELMAKTRVLKTNLYALKSYALHTEDYELWTRLIRKGYNLANITDLLYYVRINSQSVSRRFTSTQESNFTRCLKIHHEKSFGLNLSNNVVQIIANRFSAPKIKDVKLGIHYLKDIKKDFILENKSNRNEINHIFNTHLLDINIQLIKKGSTLLKIYALCLLISNINMFFSLKNLNYLKQKF